MAKYYTRIFTKNYNYKQLIMREIGMNVKVYAKTFEDEAYKQVKEMSEYPCYRNSKIRIMPDAHAGKGCVIGTTMTLTDSVTPNLVGVDIGCGMLAARLNAKDIDLHKLDECIRKVVPSGFSIHDIPVSSMDLGSLYCYKAVNDDYMQRSLGSLGGGNHFIEVNRDSDDNLILVIHSGSRNLGVQVCSYYQKLAIENLSENVNVKDVIAKLKSEGREKEIQSELKKLNPNVVNKELAHLSGVHFEQYIHDMKIAQCYAEMNRLTILNLICDYMSLSVEDYFETKHNYIDTDSMILRKGAVSAKEGERLIIPMNMRDGSLICIGKGNENWNCSAPHGAGRLMSRAKARENISMEDFRKSMSDVYTTSVGEATLDESPQAYKPMDEIISLIGDTVDIVDIIKPIYNFKAE